MRSHRLKQIGAALGFSLIVAGSSPAFAQDQSAPMTPTGAEQAATGDDLATQSEASTATTSFSTSAAGAYGQPGDRSGTTGMGHATDSSNNWLGDVAEGLSNQPMNDDSGSQTSTNATADETGNSGI